MPAAASHLAQLDDVLRKTVNLMEPLGPCLIDIARAEAQLRGETFEYRGLTDIESLNHLFGSFSQVATPEEQARVAMMYDLTNGPGYDIDMESQAPSVQLLRQCPMSLTDELAAMSFDDNLIRLFFTLLDRLHIRPGIHFGHQIAPVVMCG